jgi:chromosomal replication initiation ATPase DnaA
MTMDVSRELIPGRGPMLAIISAVIREWKITEQVLVQEGQSPTPLEARRVCAWLAERLNVRLSPEEIGQALGRDRHTYYRGVKVTERDRGTDPWLREVTDRLLAELST